MLLGACNTLLTFAMFTALQHVTAVAVAYTAAFAAGLIFSTALTPRMVFGIPATPLRRVTFACYYLVIYGVGFLVSHLLADGLPPWAVSSGTIAVTAPLGFLAGRAVLLRPTTGASGSRRHQPPSRGTPRSP